MTSALRHSGNAAQNALPEDRVAAMQVYFAQQMAQRLSRDGVTYPASIRSAFVCHPSRSGYFNPSDTRELGQTPLSVLLGSGGGRGGANRLRLLLTILWTAKSPPFDARWPSATYAWLIGLDGEVPDNRRTVARNIRWLTERGFLRAPRSLDASSSPILLEESLRRTEYTTPPSHHNDSEDDDTERTYHFYFRLPPHFFTSGMIARLSAVEIACLLIFLDELRRRDLDPETGRPIPPIEWRQREWELRYSLSDDTRQRGFGGLLDKRILQRVRGGVIPSLDNPLTTRPSYVLLDRALDGRQAEDEPSP